MKLLLALLICATQLTPDTIFVVDTPQVVDEVGYFRATSNQIQAVDGGLVAQAYTSALYNGVPLPYPTAAQALSCDVINVSRTEGGQPVWYMAVGFADGTVTVWRSAALLYSIDTGDDKVISILIANDILAAGAKLYDLLTGEFIRTLPAQQPVCDLIAPLTTVSYMTATTRLRQEWTPEGEVLSSLTYIDDAYIELPPQTISYDRKLYNTNNELLVDADVDAFRWPYYRIDGSLYLDGNLIATEIRNFNSSGYYEKNGTVYPSMLTDMEGAEFEGNYVIGRRGAYLLPNTYIGKITEVKEGILDHDSADVLSGEIIDFEGIYWKDADGLHPNLSEVPVRKFKVGSTHAAFLTYDNELYTIPLTGISRPSYPTDWTRIDGWLDLDVVGNALVMDLLHLGTHPGGGDFCDSVEEWETVHGGIEGDAIWAEACETIESYWWTEPRLLGQCPDGNFWICTDVGLPDEITLELLQTEGRYVRNIDTAIAASELTPEQKAAATTCFVYFEEAELDEATLAWAADLILDHDVVVYGHTGVFHEMYTTGPLWIGRSYQYMKGAEVYGGTVAIYNDNTVPFGAAFGKSVPITGGYLLTGSLANPWGSAVYKELRP